MLTYSTLNVRLCDYCLFCANESEFYEEKKIFSLIKSIATVTYSHFIAVYHYVLWLIIFYKNDSGGFVATESKEIIF